MTQSYCPSDLLRFRVVCTADWILARQSVLDSVDGNQDRAIDKLLGMSDPEYKEQHSTNAVSGAPPVLFIARDKYLIPFIGSDGIG